MRNIEMGILNDLLSRVEKVNEGLQTGSMIGEAIKPYSGDVLDMQLQQLWDGKAASGKDIRPYYSEDLKPAGFFHSKETAARYADWKQSITPNSNRNPDAPNLYISGVFHSELAVDMGKDAVSIYPTTMFAKGIFYKYGRNTFGLTVENWNRILFERGGYLKLMNVIKNNLFV